MASNGIGDIPPAAPRRAVRRPASGSTWALIWAVRCDRHGNFRQLARQAASGRAIRTLNAARG